MRRMYKQNSAHMRRRSTTAAAMMAGLNAADSGAERLATPGHRMGANWPNPQKRQFSPRPPALQPSPPNGSASSVQRGSWKQGSAKAPHTSKAEPMTQSPMYGGGALGGCDGGGSEGGDGGDGGGGDGGGASTEIAAITGAETCSTVTPSARLRWLSDVVLRVLATKLALASFSRMMLSATLTLEAVTVRKMRSVRTLAPSSEATAVLKSSTSKASTVPVPGRHDMRGIHRMKARCACVERACKGSV